jgi:MFS transporter, DHA1 family, multidrug resistance protein
LTGNAAYRARCEINTTKIDAKDRLYRYLVSPWRINLQDPSILFTSIYTGLLYAIFNSMFEFFPLVYGNIYGMNKGQIGQVLLCNAVAVVSSAVPYFLYIHFRVNAQLRSGKQLFPESRLMPALIASVFIPAGIFLFGWTARPEIHWIVPTMGIVFSTGGFSIILQSIFVYIGLSYPDHAASLFAGNSFAKSLVAFGGVLWAHPLYESLGLSKGMSLLGALCAVCVSGIFVLYKFGESLRKKSEFAYRE